jgi:hypothetical protein
LQPRVVILFQNFHASSLAISSAIWLTPCSLLDISSSARRKWSFANAVLGFVFSIKSCSRIRCGLCERRQGDISLEFPREITHNTPLHLLVTWITINRNIDCLIFCYRCNLRRNIVSTSNPPPFNLYSLFVLDPILRRVTKPTPINLNQRSVKLTR